MFDCYVSALCASASGASRMRHKMPRSTTMRLLFSTRPSTLNRSLHFHPLPVEVLSPSSALSHLLNARLSSAYCGLIKLVWEPVLPHTESCHLPPSALHFSVVHLLLSFFSKAMCVFLRLTFFHCLLMI